MPSTTLRPWITCILLAAAAPASAQVGDARPTLPPPGVDSPRPVEALVPDAIQVADSLFFQALDARAALDRLHLRLDVAPRDFEARWRAARAALALGIATEARKERRSWYELGERHGQQALEERPDDIEALTWTAAVKGRLAIEFGGARSKSRRGQEIWNLTHAILDMQPDHAWAHDILGKLNQEVEKLGTVQRFMGRLVMSSDPLSKSSWEQSEEHLKAAIESDPDVVLFYLDLGDTYRLQDKDEDARRVYERGLNVPIRYPPDPIFKRRIGERLAELGR